MIFVWFSLLFAENNFVLILFFSANNFSVFISIIDDLTLAGAVMFCNKAHCSQVLYGSHSYRGCGYAADGY